MSAYVHQDPSQNRRHRRAAQPPPDGQPGFLRVDTVHQGDRDGNKGVYYINTVDEVTQYEHIGCVQAISERFLLPVLEALIDAYPFKMRIPVKPITESGVKPITDSGQVDHLSERSDAGVRLCRSVIGLGQ